MSSELTDDLGKRLVRNVTWQSGSQALTLAISFVTGKLLSIHLGDVVFGDFLYLFNFLYFFQTLNDLGINTVLIREIAQAPDRTSDLVRKMLGLKMMLAAASLVMGWIAAWWLPLPQDLRRAVCVFLLVLPVQAMALPLVALQGRQMMGRASLVEAANRVTGFALMLLAIYLNRGLFAITFALIAGELAGVAAILLMTRQFTLPRPAIDVQLWVTVLKSSIPLAAAGALVAIVNRLDTMMLQAMVGRVRPTEVTYYQAAYRVTGMIERLPLMIMATIYPAMSHLARHDAGGLRRLYRRTLGAFLLAGLPLVALVLWQAPLLVRLLFARSMAPTAEYLRIIIWATGFLYVAIAGGNLLIAMGHQRANLRVWLIAAPLNVALNFILIPRYGAWGAAWATVAAFFVVMVGVLVMAERSLRALTITAHPPAMGADTASSQVL